MALDMSRDSSQEENTSQNSEITIDDSPEVVLDRISIPEENKENRLEPEKPVFKGNQSSAVVVDDESKFVQVGYGQLKVKVGLSRVHSIVSKLYMRVCANWEKT